MSCPKCGSNNIINNKNIPDAESSPKKYYSCQNCGYSYYESESTNNSVIIAVLVCVGIFICCFIIISLLSGKNINILDESKEAANRRSVEAYAKVIEYAVMEYEYNHNGELPKIYDDIADKLSSSNSDVKCYVAVNCDGKGNVVLRGCQVGNYTKKYYKYNSKNGSKGAEVDETRTPPTYQSVNGTCSY